MYLCVAEVVALSNNSLVDYGQTAVLVCVGYGEPSVSVAWYRQSMQVVNSSVVTIIEETLDQGGRQFQLSYLQICGVGVADVGVYTCMVSNSSSSASADTELQINGMHTAILSLPSHFQL